MHYYGYTTMVVKMNEIKLIDLPICSIRKGQVWNGVAIITCGFTPIDPKECIKCRGDIK